jgi:hypothetical protein
MSRLIALILALALTGCTTFNHNVSSNYYQEASPAPFAAELDFYERKMSLGKTLMLSGIIGSVALIIGTTLIINFGNPVYEKNWGLSYTAYRATLLSGYGLTTGTLAMATAGFIIWKNNSEKYLDTLRLQTQYFNLLPAGEQ